MSIRIIWDADLENAFETGLEDAATPNLALLLQHIAKELLSRDRPYLATTPAPIANLAMSLLDGSTHPVLAELVDARATAVDHLVASVRFITENKTGE